MTIEICPVCKKKDHSSEQQFNKCYEKFLKSLESGDQT